MDKNDGMMLGGAVLGLALVFASKTPKQRSFGKQYRQYRKNLRQEDGTLMFGNGSASPSGSSGEKKKTFLNMEIADTCLCGKNVSGYERQQLVTGPDGDKWFRLCEQCLNNS